MPLRASVLRAFKKFLISGKSKSSTVVNPVVPEVGAAVVPVYAAPVGGSVVASGGLARGSVPKKGSVGLSSTGSGTGTPPASLI